MKDTRWWTPRDGFDWDTLEQFSWQRCESPIEVLFYDAIMDYSRDVNADLIVKPQAVIQASDRQYRIDFLIYEHDGDWCLAVECDGREFHGLSKSQIDSDAARDDALLKMGIPTLRFTGSELQEDAAKCAYHALMWAEFLREKPLEEI